MKIYVRYPHGDAKASTWRLAKKQAGFMVNDEPGSLEQAKVEIGKLTSSQPYLDGALEVRLLVGSPQIAGCEVEYEVHQPALDQLSAELDTAKTQLAKALVKVKASDKEIEAADNQRKEAQRKAISAAGQADKFQRSDREKGREIKLRKAQITFLVDKLVKAHGEDYDALVEGLKAVAPEGEDKAPVYEPRAKVREREPEWKDVAETTPRSGAAEPTPTQAAAKAKADGRPSLKKKAKKKTAKKS